jgi:uncharacterized surface protein with fasciclin (FAS1) repeats
VPQAIRRRDIIVNASALTIHTTLVAAIKAAGLVDTLKGPGPFTVFAPTDKAFNKLPQGSIETLLKPENKEVLSSLITYHVLAGKASAAEIWQAVQRGNGIAYLKTVNGETLTAVLVENRVKLKDGQGREAEITRVDVNQINGVIHVIDTVLIP